MILEYYQIRGVPPTRANPSDAGLDINYNPDIEKEGIRHKSCYRGQEPDYWTFIRPGESAILPTGLKFGVPHGYMLEVKNRSGVAAKRKLIVGACVVDAGYDGEVFVNLHNVGKEVQFLRPGDKIAQVVLTPVVHFRAMATHEDNLYDWYPIAMSNRGDGALGSTDKKCASEE